MRIHGVQLLKSSDLGRHSLLYLKEIGYGWFGKVLLGEVNAGLSTTQVVVKELKASASVQDQMQFLEEVQQYRTLQHPALLQCLAQCTEVTPYLLVMEFCPLGDLKTYLHSCRVADAETPDPLILQRMACDIASGLLHLHKHNVIHSDLALRNCLLTSEMTVKIGDYGLSHSRYKEDYYITQDQIWVALRWIAPELIDEVHGNLLVVDQTKSSNIWSLGVTVWELFELGNQPYRQYSDRQVLTYVVKEQQLKLPKPQIQFPLAERWYEVMQFCWLQPELRPCSEEVHLLVTYLCAKGSSEAEEDFEQRWNALKPNLLGSDTHTATSTALVLTPTPPQAEVTSTEPAQTVELASSASSSFPLLEHFSDSFHSDTGDDLLTVTETSHGLNFEYKWEQARAEQPYCSSSTSGPLGQGNPHYQDIYYSSKESTSGGCRTDSLTSGVSLSYYEPEHPGVVPVLSAHSPSVGSEYYIRIEEPVECRINLEDTAVDYSPVLEAHNSRLFCESPPVSSVAASRAYWSTANRCGEYDSDSSPADKLTTDPLLKRAPSPCCLSPHQDGMMPCRQSCRSELDSSPECESNLIGSVRCLENSRSLSKVVSSPSLGFCDPYLEASSGHGTVNESCHNMTGPLRKTQPLANHISIDVGSEDGLLVGRQRGDNCEDDLLSEGDATNWTSNHSANNNSLMFDNRQTGSGHDSYLDFHYVDHCNNTPSWSLSKPTTKTFQSSTSFGKVESGRGDNEPSELTSYIHLSQTELDKTAAQFELNRSRSSGVGSRLYSEPQMIPETSFIKSPSSFKDSQSGPTAFSDKHRGHIWDGVPAVVNCPETLESTRVTDGRRESSSALVDIGDYSEDEDDMADITSGIFADYNLDYAEGEDEELSPVKNPEETTSSADILNMSSSMASPSDQAFSPFNTTILPKSLDSGYDTENNESPEFFFKELGDPQESERSPRLAGDPDLVLLVGLGQGVCTSTSNSELQLKSLTDKNTYRDSAYFSDYDAENERSPQKEGSQFFAGPNNHELNSENVSCVKSDETLIRHVNNENLTNLRLKKGYVAVKFSAANASPPHSLPAPALSMLAPFPPMGGCLTKESAPAEDNLGLDTEQSGEGEEASSDFSSIASEPSSALQEASINQEESNRKSEDSSSVKSSSSDSNQTDCKDEASKENDGSTEEEELPEFNHTEEERMESVRINEEDFEDIDADESDSQDSLCEQSNGPGELSTSSSLLELYGEDVRAPLEQAEDEEDSDDSESDDELRTYNIHEEESEESEEDFTVVPVVVSDCSRARHLRSLLKMPSLLTQTFCDEIERKKKAVSFFDDVTVYLFDQESPTGELANYTFPSAAEACGNNSSDGKTCELEPQPESELEDKACETCISEESDGNNSGQDGSNEREEEEAAFENPPSPEDPTPASLAPPTSTSKTTEDPKPPAVALNRFLVSRFSITQVSDSYVNANTGDSEESSRD